MRKRELNELQKGEVVEHKHFGLCVVDDLLNELSGVVLRPLTMEGVNLLASWSGVQFNRAIEDDPRLILCRIFNPTIPKLIFKVEGGFEVHEWQELGEVSADGEFSSVKLGCFASVEEVNKFING